MQRQDELARVRVGERSARVRSVAPQREHVLNAGRAQAGDVLRDLIPRKPGAGLVRERREPEGALGLRSDVKGSLAVATASGGTGDAHKIGR